MASQQDKSIIESTDGISQMRSKVYGNCSGNTGSHNVFGNGNIICSMQMPRDMTNSGGTNEWQAMRARDGEAGEASRPYWIVPYCRNGAFTGRESVIKSLKEVCKSGAHNRVALHGLGGCGKTQIALEYVCRLSGEGHNDVFWVQGSGMMKFREGFKAIAHHVRIPLTGAEKDEEELLRRTRTWLEGPDSGDWILVIDNADNDVDFIGNNSPIAKFVPQGREGTVIFTTRSRQVAIRQGCKIIRVGEMEPEEALELFSKRFDNWQSLEDEEKGAVSRILDSMDHLPLAVVGSAAFMAENGTPPSVYWSIFQENDRRTKELLSEQFCDIQREVDMTESILGTYFITFDRITEQMPLMAKFLGLIAFLDRQKIPEELLARSGVEDMDDSLKFRQAIGKLLRFSLVTEVKLEGTTFYELHRLVQLSIQAYLSTEQANQGRATGLRAVSRLFPGYEYKRRNICAAYMSHALVLTKDSTDTIAERLVYRMGKHFIEMGSYSNAEIQVRHCLALRETDKDRDWEGESFSRILLLGELHWYQGRASEAEAIFLKVLQDLENTSGLEHPNTLLAVVDLALVLWEQARYQESEMMNRRALEGYEKCFGLDHPNTLMAVINLASVLFFLGRYGESAAMNHRALEGYKKHFGSDHPHTLMAVNNLALVLWGQGRYRESKVLNRHALMGCEKALGSDHPLTLGLVNNLARVLRLQGRYAESEMMNRRALEGWEKALGPDHPRTLEAVRNLSILLLKQGKCIESEILSRHALEGTEKAMGPDHTRVLSTIDNLAQALEAQGKYAETEKLLQRALATRKSSLGPEHPSVCKTLERLACLHEQRGRYPQAKEAYERACKGFSMTLGEQHPTTLECIKKFEQLCGRQPIPASTGQVAAEPAGDVVNHLGSPGERAFSLLKALWWYPGKLGDRWSSP